MNYDIVIIGAGPAGLTAAIYSARNGLKTGVISKDIGGTANSILSLENWPGFKGPGSKLMKQFYDHAKEYDLDFIMSEALSIKKEKKGFSVKTSKGDIQTSAVIIATGTDRRKLKIPGEERLIGRGVSYCVTCDAFFFKNKTVAVIGGSDCAATSAVALTGIAKKVYVIYRGEKLRCEAINTKRLNESKNAEMIYNAIPEEIKGKDKVEGIVIKDKNGKKREIKIDGVFVEIGSTPLLEFAKDINLKLDKENCIVVDDLMKSSVDGVFAAGDATNAKVKQVVTAAAQGAIAAKSANEWLKK